MAGEFTQSLCNHYVFQDFRTDYTLSWASCHGDVTSFKLMLYCSPQKLIHCLTAV